MARRKRARANHVRITTPQESRKAAAPEIVLAQPSLADIDSEWNRLLQAAS